MKSALLAFLFCWTVTGHVVRVIDADTFVAEIPAWMEIMTTERIRVLYVDGWERQDPRGPAAKAFTEKWLALGPVTITACKRDAFGRVLGIVTRGQDNLAEQLIKSGHGRPR